MPYKLESCSQSVCASGYELIFFHNFFYTTNTLADSPLTKVKVC